MKQDIIIIPAKEDKNVEVMQDWKKEMIAKEQQKSIQKPKPTFLKKSSKFFSEYYKPKKTKKKKISRIISTSQFGKIFLNKPILKKRDNLKILKLRSMLEKQRLQNEIEKLKIRNSLQSLKMKKKPITTIQEGMKPTFLPLYPAYSSPVEKLDLDSAFTADIGHGDNLFGNESYFSEESYYPEDFYGNEFYNTSEEHLGLKVNQRLSPLLW